MVQPDLLTDCSHPPALLTKTDGRIEPSWHVLVMVIGAIESEAIETKLGEKLRNNRRFAAVCAVISLALAGCAAGGPDSPSSASFTGSSEDTNSEEAALTMPDLSGMSVSEARSEIGSVDPESSLGLDSSWIEELGLESDDESVLDGTAFESLIIESTDPAAGEELEPGSSIDTTAYFPVPDGVPAKQAWMATCGYGVSNQTEVFSLKEIWEENEFGCTFEMIPGRELKLSKKEAKALAIITHSEDDDEVTQPVGEYLITLRICANWSIDSTDFLSSTRKELKAASQLCPDAPEHDNLAAWGDGKAFSDGDYVVGKDIAAGAYRSTEGVSDCYWERSTANGQIIANNLITHAAQGALVTIRSGETLTTKRCGVWTAQ